MKPIKLDKKIYKRAKFVVEVDVPKDAKEIYFNVECYAMVRKQSPNEKFARIEKEVLPNKTHIITII